MKKLVMYTLCLILLAALNSCAGTEKRRAYEPRVGWEQALEAAEELAPEYGYDLDYMNIELLLDVTPWENRFPGLEFFKQPRYTDIDAKLAGRHYWAVNCVPTFPRYGGSFCVFVDAETGELIHVFTGW